MKLNIKGLVFVGFAAAVFASAANAAGEEKTVTSVKFTEATYQKKLTAGDNITIDPSTNTITATDTTYTAGTGIDITGGAISATGDITAYTGAGDTTVANHVITTNVPVKGIKAHGATETITPVNGIVELPAGTVDTNTTYTFASGSTPKAFQVTDSATNTAQTVAINGLGSAAEADVSTTGVAADENDLVTGAQVAAYVGTQVGSIDQYSAGDNVTFGTAGQDGKIPINATDTTYTAGTGITISGANNAIAVDGDITPYTAGTNVQISGHQISATDTTYAAGTHVTISGDNNAINVADNGTIAANDTGLVTGQTVYNYVTGLIPATLPNTCTTAAPCAMVLANGTVSWEPIQQ